MPVTGTVKTYDAEQNASGDTGEIYYFSVWDSNEKHSFFNLSTLDDPNVYDYAYSIACDYSMKDEDWAGREEMGRKIWQEALHTRPGIRIDTLAVGQGKVFVKALMWWDAGAPYGEISFDICFAIDPDTGKYDIFLPDAKASAWGLDFKKSRMWQALGNKTAFYPLHPGVLNQSKNSETVSLPNELIWTNGLWTIDDTHAIGPKGTVHDLTFPDCGSGIVKGNFCVEDNFIIYIHTKHVTRLNSDGTIDQFYLDEDKIKAAEAHPLPEFVIGESGNAAPTIEIPEAGAATPEPAEETPAPAGKGDFIFCVYCGQKLPAGAKFCSACGKPVVKL